MGLFKHQRAEAGAGAAPVTSLDQLPPPPATAWQAAAPADIEPGSPQAAADPVTSPPPEAPQTDPGPSQNPPLVVPKTRTSAAYVGVSVGLVVLVLVIIFIAQNLRDATVHFLGASFKMPIGLLVLASAVAGGIIVLLVSAARVAQLRLMAHRHQAGRPTR
ncbi:lipopolysaccharide assembly protein LapA domain-containing protein [Acidiferrimicrobium sp. IK]|uniref:LapA family protein n=1 Tax=Acidiferrimicrobium sp. IK TaxID=2871700 RepID=UPI0021CAE72D|nr:lipopolysaccharide assembly protein LapA domain-containing protein [Acidiferrimicrobium sp. IK]MCU4184275.1 lipopolysaccharide assembly protein LapA domain-containing protein [Acidiferrimicrobium sp. IK]